MKRILLVIIVLSASVKADDITTISGKKYTSVAVSYCDPLCVTVTTDSGIERIPFAELPADLRQKYGYDETKAVAFQKSEVNATANRLAAKEIQKIVEESIVLLHGKIIQRVGKGALIAGYIWKAEYGQQEAIAGGYKWRPEYGRRNLSEPVFVDEVSNNAVDGDAFSEVVLPYGTYKYEATSGAGKTVRAFTISKSRFVEFLKK